MNSKLKQEKSNVLCGKKSNKVGITPAIGLINPKNAVNLAQIIRVASCYGIEQVWYTGHRVADDLEGRRRLPREERMKGYRDVQYINHDYILERFEDVTPVCVEVRKDAVPLPYFDHPRNPLYLFGPEDGSIGQPWLQHCHHFVIVPTRHCLNLSHAVSTLLYDRLTKLSESEWITPGEWESRGPYGTS